MIYKCSECGFESKNYFGLCQRCKIGIGEEVESTASSLNITSKTSNKVIEKYEIRSVDKNYKSDKIVKETQFDSLNKILSTAGGFVEEQVILLGASPGVGKSTLCTQISDKDTIYIGTEESFNQINNRFLRVNSNSKSKIVSVTTIETILDIIETDDSKFIIIDSLNNINNGMDGYVRSAQNLNRITSAIKKKNKFGIIISQVTKSGEITGMNTLMHSVDTVMYLEKSSISDNLIMVSTKNRFGAVGSIAMFRHETNGLLEINNYIEKGEDLVGVSYTKSRFGYRNMDVAIESLVAPSSLNYGLRKANGVPLARLQQILGVLAYNNKSLNFTNKDVYIAVSSGLTVTDTKMDLAIANSILSSYYGIPSPFSCETPISGEIALNGVVRGSSIKRISHICDLIDIYKNPKI